jgi:hypothetical protein
MASFLRNLFSGRVTADAVRRVDHVSLDKFAEISD